VATSFLRAPAVGGHEQIASRRSRQASSPTSPAASIALIPHSAKNPPAASSKSRLFYESHFHAPFEASFVAHVEPPSQKTLKKIQKNAHPPRSIWFKCDSTDQYSSANFLHMGNFRDRGPYEGNTKSPLQERMRPSLMCPCQRWRANGMEQLCGLTCRLKQTIDLVW